MNNINIECEDDDYYDKFIEESSPRTNYGENYKTEKNERRIYHHKQNRSSKKNRTIETIERS